MLFLKEKVKSRCAVDGVWKCDIVVCYVCVKGTDNAAAVGGIWTDIIVVLFPLSFYLKKKAPKKSRHKRGRR